MLFLPLVVGCSLKKKLTKEGVTGTSATVSYILEIELEVTWNLVSLLRKPTGNLSYSTSTNTAFFDTK